MRKLDENKLAGLYTAGELLDNKYGEVVKRIPGISIIDDKFVIARGLSQRYKKELLL